jgi:hypothetical protein
MEALIYYRKDYQESYRVGDIIEVRPSGYYAQHGYNSNAFRVVIFPENIFNQEWIDPVIENGQLIKRRKFYLDYNLDQVRFYNINQINNYMKGR